MKSWMLSAKLSASSASRAANLPPNGKKWAYKNDMFVCGGSEVSVGLLADGVVYRWDNTRVLLHILTNFGEGGRRRGVFIFLHVFLCSFSCAAFRSLLSGSSCGRMI